MKGRRLIVVIVIAVTGVIALIPTDEKRIRKVIHSTKKAITGEDLEMMMDHISFNYSDEHGGSYLRLKKRAEAAFKRYDSFDITVDIMNIRVEDEKSKAWLKVSVIASEGDDRGYFIGDAGGAEDFNVYLEKSPYEWKIIKMESVVKQAKQ